MARVVILLLTFGLVVQGLWPALIAPPGAGSVEALILTQSTLPRIAMALLAGFTLSLAGEVCQRIFANPLAEPGILGISGGASLALSLGLLVFPALWQAAPVAVAMTGAGAALGLVMLVAWGRGLQAQTLILAGVMVNLCASAMQSLIVLFNHDFLQELLTWQAGSLVQSGWSAGLWLAVQVAPVLGVLMLMRRPLHLLMLGTPVALGLGVNVVLVRLGLLVAAAFVTAAVIASFGQIGFVGLAGPALARALRDRQGPGMVQAGLWGAVLLLLADQVARLLSSVAGDVPVGAASGLFIGPLLIAISVRARHAGLPARPEPAQALPADRSAWWLMPLVLMLPLLILAATFIGQSPSGLVLHPLAGIEALIRWRLPPVLLAAGAGMCLALSGLILQRVLHNPLGSPDLLGLGQGAALAFALAMILLPEGSLGSRFAITALGAGLTLAMIAVLGLRAGLAPGRVLLIGVGLGSSANALLVLVLAAGGPRAAVLLGWYSGSTGGAGLMQAALPWAVGGGVLALMLVLRRWFTLLSLDADVALGLGLPLRRARLIALAMAALAAAAGTIALGPVSFIGLIVPHLAASLGFRATGPAALASAGLGAALMALAQWLGGLAAWPWPMAPGLIATVIGGPWLLWQIRKRAA